MGGHVAEGVEPRRDWVPRWAPPGAGGRDGGHPAGGGERMMSGASTLILNGPECASQDPWCGAIIVFAIRVAGGMVNVMPIHMSPPYCCIEVIGTPSGPLTRSPSR